MLYTRLLVVSAATELALAGLFQIACSVPLVIDRIDPIVSPGASKSNHMHTVQGGSGFSPGATYEDLHNANCTSCGLQQDHSNYWYPRMYFRDPKTKLFEPVGGGGLVVHYLNDGDGAKNNGGEGLKAFPEGFKMISGDMALRGHQEIEKGSQEDLTQRAAEYTCLRANESEKYDGHGFPNTNCESGFTARIHMPACWDGNNLDSDDHRAHTAHLSDLTKGSCPPTHPISMVKLVYEVNWEVQTFSSRWNPDVDEWPFVYSTGDPTGFSWHGDFQNGWNTSLLQTAIDECDSPDPKYCAHMSSNEQAEAAALCKIPAVVQEVGLTSFSSLSGCNPIQYGPDRATEYFDENCPQEVDLGNGSDSGSSSGVAPPTVPFAAGNLLTLGASLLLTLIWTW